MEGISEVSNFTFMKDELLKRREGVFKGWCEVRLGLGRYL